MVFLESANSGADKGPTGLDPAMTGVHRFGHFKAALPGHRERWQYRHEACADCPSRQAHTERLAVKHNATRAVADKALHEARETAAMGYLQILITYSFLNAIPLGAWRKGLFAILCDIY